MRKLAVILIVIIAATISGCASKDDEEFDNLVSQAVKYRDELDLVSAKQLFEKALDIREDSQIRKSVQKLTNEIAEVKKFNDLCDRLLSKRNALDSAMSRQDVRTTAKEIDVLISEIKNYDTNTEYSVSKYVNRMKESLELISLSVSVISVQATQDFDVIEKAQEIKNQIDELIASVQYPDAYKSIK
ncbi:hypothetical protein IJ21_15530 [Paenibacillus sp. 32O-W]|uniref:hypothetical protein n=1 Tax=Paenibacillus sp. 32O-W TaxID=1695218 RepID=UPI0007230094|nr:hypothetical protein [Paenibacillus sp. 32O-W]ALS26957.1 hypothetical protein IJ21_15530 [Paenibacillus sp. 32O-W]